ncbi:MAG TPA: hypothetical protein VJ868_01955, partial [Actinomycetota bacterium]|nr:hypothetical protein [Actinomycetota bacterium]
IFTAVPTQEGAEAAAMLGLVGAVGVIDGAGDTPGRARGPADTTPAERPLPEAAAAPAGTAGLAYGA